MDNWNYPMGADTPDAPWNRGGNTREVDVVAVSTWERNASVECPVMRDEDEDGVYVWTDTENIQDDFLADNDSMEFLMDEFGKILKELIEKETDLMKMKKYRRLLNELNEWTETDLEIKEC